MYVVPVRNQLNLLSGTCLPPAGGGYLFLGRTRTGIRGSLPLHTPAPHILILLLGCVWQGSLDPSCPRSRPLLALRPMSKQGLQGGSPQGRVWVMGHFSKIQSPRSVGISAYNAQVEAARDPDRNPPKPDFSESSSGSVPISPALGARSVGSWARIPAHL